MHAFGPKQNQPQQKSSANLPRSRVTPAASQETHRLTHLQRTIGNQAVLRLLRAHSDPEGQIKEALGTNSNTHSNQSPVTKRIVISGGSGEPLPPDARAEMETRFGYDFRRVRTHTNNRTAASLGAKAITRGQDIYFGPGRGVSDRRLLTHEIAHVVQQATGESAHLDGAGGNASHREMLEARANRSSGQMSHAEATPDQPLKPLPAVSSAVMQFEFEDDVLRELHRMPSSEEEGISKGEQQKRTTQLRERIQRLHILFNGLSADEAKRIHERLKQRKKGDVLSQRFHDMLSTATREALLTVLASRKDADVVPPAVGPPISTSLRYDQKVKIKGLPPAQPNYADRSFQGLLSAPVGDVYELCTQPLAQCQKPISIPKTQFYLDDDPLAKGAIYLHAVYPSRDVAEAVLANMRVDALKDVPLVTYYLRDGIIFPTTLSATTLPNLIPQVRQKRDADRGDVKATGDLAEDVAWWYVGMRLPIKIKSGGGGGTKVPAPGAGAPAAKAAFSAVEVAEGLFVATKTIANPGQRMLAAAKQLSAMMNLSAVQKAEAMMEFFRKIGFSVQYVKGAAWVDEGLHLVMYSEDARYAFRFIKSTGEIVYGKIDKKTFQYVWEILK